VNGYPIAQLRNGMLYFAMPYGLYNNDGHYSSYFGPGSNEIHFKIVDQCWMWMRLYEKTVFIETPSVPYDVKPVRMTYVDYSKFADYITDPYDTIYNMYNYPLNANGKVFQTNLYNYVDLSGTLPQYNNFSEPNWEFGIDPHKTFGVFKVGSNIGMDFDFASDKSHDKLFPGYIFSDDHLNVRAWRDTGYGNLQIYVKPELTLTMRGLSGVPSGITETEIMEPSNSLGNGKGRLIIINDGNWRLDDRALDNDIEIPRFVKPSQIDGVSAWYDYDDSKPASQKITGNSISFTYYSGGIEWEEPDSTHGFRFFVALDEPQYPCPDNPTDFSLEIAGTFTDQETNTDIDVIDEIMNTMYDHNYYFSQVNGLSQQIRLLYDANVGSETDPFNPFCVSHPDGQRTMCDTFANILTRLSREQGIDAKAAVVSSGQIQNGTGYLVFTSFDLKNENPAAIVYRSRPGPAGNTPPSWAPSSRWPFRWHQVCVFGDQVFDPVMGLHEYNTQNYIDNIAIWDRKYEIPALYEQPIPGANNDFANSSVFFSEHGDSYGPVEDIFNQYDIKYATDPFFIVRREHSASSQDVNLIDKFDDTENYETTESD
jgi:hypothetical protein